MGFEIRGVRFEVRGVRFEVRGLRTEGKEFKRLGDQGAEQKAQGTGVWGVRYKLIRVQTETNYFFKNSSGVIPACFKIARKVPSGMSPG